MGVDSGLPDFRGDHGFWKAYPPFAKLGLRFIDLANPHWFERDPELAWGFYGHRMNLYRATKPHEGFSILRRWGAAKPNGYFVYTSNVDGHFEEAGFASDRIMECHGSIHHMQCAARCSRAIWSSRSSTVAIDDSTFRAGRPLPACTQCGGMARPNILMFGDGGWLWERTEEQQDRLTQWLKVAARGPIAIIECGAGTAVPSVRHFSESLVDPIGAALIRINIRESDVPAGQIGIPLGAKDALRAIDGVLSER